MSDNLDRFRNWPKTGICPTCGQQGQEEIKDPKDIPWDHEEPWKNPKIWDDGKVHFWNCDKCGIGIERDQVNIHFCSKCGGKCEDKVTNEINIIDGTTTKGEIHYWYCNNCQFGEIQTKITGSDPKYVVSPEEDLFKSNPTSKNPFRALLSHIQKTGEICAWCKKPIRGTIYEGFFDGYFHKKCLQKKDQYDQEEIETECKICHQMYKHPREFVNVCEKCLEKYGCKYISKDISCGYLTEDNICSSMDECPYSDEDFKNDDEEDLGEFE